MTDEQRRRLEEARKRHEAELAELAETARQSFASFVEVALEVALKH